MSNTIRLLLVDDHQVVRLGLRALLSAESDLEVVGEAGTAAKALTQVDSLRPEVVLMDVRLPGQSGITACQQIHQRWPEVKVLMLTSFADESLAQVAEGKTNAEIGAILMLSEKTVRNHVSTILDKLGCTNRIEAATYAVRNHVERYTHEV
jgi:DNA-binding NarL/FixJ family response regulator